MTTKPTLPLLLPFLLRLTRWRALLHQYGSGATVLEVSRQMNTNG
jgi:hypothetical protein